MNVGKSAQKKHSAQKNETLIKKEIPVSELKKIL